MTTGRGATTGAQRSTTKATSDGTIESAHAGAHLSASTGAIKSAHPDGHRSASRATARGSTRSIHTGAQRSAIRSAHTSSQSSTRSAANTSGSNDVHTLVYKSVDTSAVIKLETRSQIVNTSSTDLVGASRSASTSALTINATTTTTTTMKMFMNHLTSSDSEARMTKSLRILSQVPQMLMSQTFFEEIVNLYPRIPEADQKVLDISLNLF
jgi:hypothetical protein